MEDKEEITAQQHKTLYFEQSSNKEELNTLRLVSKLAARLGLFEYSSLRIKM